MQLDEETEVILRELWRREQREKEFASLLFPSQAKFIKDKAKRKAALCSRRAGKSYGVGKHLIDQIKSPVEGDVAYVGLTRSHAKKVMFNHLIKLNDKYKLRLEPNKSELSLTHKDTKNTIYITGANTEDDAEKLRGLKLKTVVLDEVASFRTHINYLIEEVLEPTLIDLDGDMLLIGTPSANPGENYFYKVTNGEENGWSVHKWTILDNPFIPHAKKWLEDYRIRKNWTLDNPIYLREWLGVWTYDDSSLVYKYSNNNNDYTDLPNGSWNYIAGVDLGFDDAFTINVMAFSYEQKEIYSVYQYKKSGLIPAKMAEILAEVLQQYRPIRTVADHGGLGKAIVEEFKARYKLPIYPAEKTKKAAFIEIINGDLKAGLIKIKKDSLLAQEMRIHQWAPDRPGKEDDRTENDLCDAFLYSAKECKHYLSQLSEPKPKEGSREYFEAQAKELLQKEIDQFEKQSEEELWLK